MASKRINIRWIRTGSQPYRKIMYIILYYPVFYEYLNALRILGLTKLVNLIIVHFYIRGKLFIIRLINYYLCILRFLGLFVIIFFVINLIRFLNV